MADVLARNPFDREDGRRRTGLMSAEQKFSAEEEEEALAAALETAACRQRPRCLAAKDRDSMTVERETTKTKTKMKGMSSTKAPTWPRTRSAVLCCASQGKSSFLQLIIFPLFLPGSAVKTKRGGGEGRGAQHGG